MTLIGIIGIGIVGTGILEGLQHVSINQKVELDIKSYDKYKNIGSFNNILNTNILFICVPTIFCETKNEYDKSELHNVLKLLKEHKYEGIILIKSTVEPLVCEKLYIEYDLKIIHNPEFLSASTNVDDFINQEHIVIGKTDGINDSDLNKINKFYRQLFPNSIISNCTSNESECMKIFVNNFYSVKIQFFTELHELCNKINLDYNKIKDMMIKNNWINPMHTNVPGTDGQISYGGMCFPKDTNALLEFMKKNNTPHKLLESCVNERNSMRNDHINVNKK